MYAIMELTTKTSMKTKKIDLSHMQILGKTVVCRHCGEKYELNLPIPVYLMQAIIDAFMKRHKRCKSFV